MSGFLLPAWYWVWFGYHAGNLVGCGFSGYLLGSVGRGEDFFFGGYLLGSVDCGVGFESYIIGRIGWLPRW